VTPRRDLGRAGAAASAAKTANAARFNPCSSIKRPARAILAQETGLVNLAPPPGLPCVSNPRARLRPRAEAEWMVVMGGGGVGGFLAVRLIKAGSDVAIIARGRICRDPRTGSRSRT
jgi:hypothetical protein